MTGACINFAVPCYGGQMRANFVHSLYPLLGERLAGRCRFVFSEIDYADIVAARNYLISNFYFNKPDCTHLLMVDTDMGFGDDLVTAMLALDQPVVGAIYPRRGIDLRRLHALRDLPFEAAYARSLDFVGKVLQPPRQSGDFVRMESCGTGILLVSRACVTRMIECLPDIVDTKAFRTLPFTSGLDAFLTPFDRIRTADAEYAEDMSFCRRWTQDCGGEIWASFRHRISHAGAFTVTASLADREVPGTRDAG
jgi:hypothetical protein